MMKLVNSHLIPLLVVFSLPLLSYTLTAPVQNRITIINPQLEPFGTHHDLRMNRVRSHSVALNYEPKWKKKETLADQSSGDNVDFKDLGIEGSIKVVFKEGDEEKTTMANVGDPIRDLASQTGTFIKYGCGKGECGTCEALCNGKWIRPCMATVPSDLAEGEEYTIQVKSVKAKSKSSGKFYSVKSFFMGFYNNLLGMVGFVMTRRAARKNYQERMDFEDEVRRLTLEKKAKKANKASDESKKELSLKK